MNNLPFDRLCIIINQQNFTKTANCWGISNNERGVNTNRIVVAQKLSLRVITLRHHLFQTNTVKFAGLDLGCLINLDPY